jgi:hypothetical protein
MMMSKLNEIEEYVNESVFFAMGSQQFATVIFDRGEDSKTCHIVVTIVGGETYEILGNNKYNPSLRRISTCVYVVEEGEPIQDQKIIKICTIQHKGNTLIEIHSVDDAEIDYLFGGPFNYAELNRSPAQKIATRTLMNNMLGDATDV